MAVTVEPFSEWAFQIRYTIVDGTDVAQTTWIVPAPFSCMPYINYAKDLPESTAPDLVRISHP